MKEYHNGQAMAPLSIATKSDGNNYVIKVVNWNTKSYVLTTFIRSGEKASIKVPLGSYEIRYAARKTWYGYEYLFALALPITRLIKGWISPNQAIHIMDIQ